VNDGLDVLETETSLGTFPSAVGLKLAQAFCPLARLDPVHHHPQGLAPVAVTVALDDPIELLPILLGDGKSYGCRCSWHPQTSFVVINR
jgi:hypothetical protein